MTDDLIIAWTIGYNMGMATFAVIFVIVEWRAEQRRNKP